MIFRPKAKILGLFERKEMSNRYDEQYEFRVANINDITAIMDFIDKNWKSGHIMATNRELFEYEFLEEDGTVNFILAVDRKKGTIECLCGILKASHDPDHLDVWGSIWKALDGNMGMLGTELLRRRKDMTKCRCDMGVGYNPKTAVPLVKVLLKRYTTKMKHYYILADRNDFKIADIKYIPKVSVSDTQYSVVKLENITELQQKFDAKKYAEYIPYKDFWYINHRFYQHPVYKYDVYGVEKDGEVDAILVFRKQHYENRIAIRFVDYIGNRSLISGIGCFLMQLLSENENNEYIDFYNAGLDEKLIFDAGFTEVKEGDSNIIPNYFEPFVRANIDIWVDSRDATTLFTKADADQDRPNRI